jgi:hypothetical protein
MDILIVSYNAAIDASGALTKLYITKLYIARGKGDDSALLR